MEIGDNSLLQKALTLTVEQEFTLRRLKTDVGAASREELEGRLVELMRLYLIQQNITRHLIRQGVRNGTL